MGCITNFYFLIHPSVIFHAHLDQLLLVCLHGGGEKNMLLDQDLIFRLK